MTDRQLDALSYVDRALDLLRGDDELACCAVLGTLMLRVDPTTLLRHLTMAAVVGSLFLAPPPPPPAAAPPGRN